MINMITGLLCFLICQSSVSSSLIKNSFSKVINFRQSLVDKITLPHLDVLRIRGGSQYDANDLNRNTTNINEIMKNGNIKYQQAGGLLFFTTFLEAYSTLIESHTLPTKIISSAIVGCLGDTFIQKFESRKTPGKPFDFRRLVVFALVCGLYIAPVVHCWFDYLSKISMFQSMSNTSKAFAMMLVDQSVGAIIITSGFFFAFELVSKNFFPSEFFSLYDS